MQPTLVAEVQDDVRQTAFESAALVDKDSTSELARVAADTNELAEADSEADNTELAEVEADNTELAEVEADNNELAEVAAATKLVESKQLTANSQKSRQTISSQKSKPTISSQGSQQTARSSESQRPHARRSRSWLESHETTSCWSRRRQRQVRRAVQRHADKPANGNVPRAIDGWAAT